ncbi:penicillin-binding transpeptidase domain-containing protein [Schaedlerella arabinosiphila]|uniref:penicillin-binding transpeptidase domain-containing protein n=1 Tax=Schaedlerella arabinosiphila TaxID=2044587 RepID=UPI002F419F76
MDPCSGEVLALVSTPSFDSNEFILGLSDARWNALNEDERKPLLNRFRQIWCPGSTLKPVIASIGLKTGAVDWQEDFGNEGLSWQKDATWGDYYITTLHAYEPVTMENALIYSDNIYFAKAALGIGADVLERELNIMGFGEQIPFEIVMPPSQYSNTEHIESEIQLADSGYGQGQILVNPLHMAGLYTAFCNEGTEIGWFAVFTAEKDAEDSLLIVSMVENVKEIGGSGYVVSKDRNALDAYWGSGQ